MLSEILYIVIGAILLAVAYEDFYYREVKWIFFPALGLLLVFCRGLIVEYFLVNLLFLIFLLGSGFCYLFFKTGKISNPFASYFGLGDLLFLMALATWFHPVFFVLFNVLSLLIALILHYILHSLSKLYRRHESVPLAGIQSLCFLLLLVMTLHPGFSYAIQNF